MKLFILLGLLVSLNVFASDDYSPPITVLKNNTKFVIHRDATYEQELETLYSVDTDSGIKTYSTAKLSYDSTSEKCDIVEAYTIQKNGQKIYVKPNAIKTVTDPVTDDSPMFSDIKNIVIIFPKVEKGSKIYYKAKSHIFKTQFPRIFSYSSYMPTSFVIKESNYDFLYDPAINLRFEKNGIQGGSSSFKSKMKRITFHYSNSLVNSSEPGEVDEMDFAPYLRISNLEGYEHLARLYEERASLAARNTEQIQRKADEITRGISNRKEQAKAIYEWVSQNIRYVYLDFGQGGVVPHKAEEILENRYGDCKDHSTLLQSLLSAKKIASNQVLVNSGEAFKLPKIADISPFNHAINYIPEFNLFLDSTAALAPFGTLPLSDSDKSVLIIGANQLGKTPALKAEDNFIMVDTSLEMNPDGSFKGVSKFSATGPKEISLRDDYEYFNSLRMDVAAKKIFTANKETGKGTYRATNPLDLSKKFFVESNFVIDAPGNVPGPSGIFIPIGLAPGLLEGIGNYKPIDKRSHSAICTSAKIIEKTKIIFPKTISILNFPENKEFAYGDYQYKSTYQLVNKELMISRELTSEHKRGFCEARTQEDNKIFTKMVRQDIRSQIIYK